MNKPILQRLETASWHDVNFVHIEGVGSPVLPVTTKLASRQFSVSVAGISLRVHPANERRRYTVTSSLIDWVHSQNDPCGGYILPSYLLALAYFTRDAL